MLSFKKVKNLKHYMDIKYNFLIKTFFSNYVKKYFQKTLILFEIMSVLCLMNHPI